MRVAAVFPGQGSHQPGMASAWSGHPAAITFDEVGRACGLPDLARLADDPATCRSTAVGQPAVFAASLAAWRALDLEPDVVAGHSLGEYTAAVAAGSLTVKDGGALVGERGRAFASACQARPGVMAAVLGLDPEVVRACCDAVEGAVIANDNAPGQLVVAGTPHAIDAVTRRCRERGGRVRPLDVEGAFHTSAMTSAIVRVATFIRRLDVQDPTVPLVSGMTADVIRTGRGVVRSLVDGILGRVRWREVQNRLGALGVSAIVEVGPGGVLRGLAKRSLPHVRAVAVGAPAGIAEVAELVDGHAPSRPRTPAAGHVR